MVVKKFAVCCVVVSAAFVLLGAGSATAGPGDGLKAGNLKLHPRVTLSGAYDTNVFRSSPEELDEQRGAPIVMITPGLSIATVDPTTFKLDFDGELGWDQYIGSDQSIRGQGGLGGSANLGGTLNPKGNVSFRLEDNLDYRNVPPNRPQANTYSQLNNSVGGILGIHPGNRILQLDLGYHYDLTRYITRNLRDLDQNIHAFDLNLTWRFLPKTAFVIESDFDVIRYQEAFRGEADQNTPARFRLPNVNSTPLDVKAGLSGLITPRISLRLLGGWAAGFYETGPTFSNFVAHTSATYHIGTKQLGSNLTAGYERDFEDTGIANYAGQHRGFLNYTHNFFDRAFGYSIKGEYRYNDYADLQVGETEVTTQSGNTRRFKTVRNRRNELVFLPDNLHDEIVTAGAGIHSEIDWWRGELSYEFSTNLSGDRIDIPVQDVTRFREFFRHYVLAQMTFKY